MITRPLLTAVMLFILCMMLMAITGCNTTINCNATGTCNPNVNVTGNTLTIDGLLTGSLATQHHSLLINENGDKSIARVKSITQDLGDFLDLSIGEDLTYFESDDNNLVSIKHSSGNAITMHYSDITHKVDIEGHTYFTPLPSGEFTYSGTNIWYKEGDPGLSWGGDVIIRADFADGEGAISNNVMGGTINVNNQTGVFTDRLVVDDHDNITTVLGQFTNHNNDHHARGIFHSQDFSGAFIASKE